MAQTAQAQRKPQARDWPFEVKPLHPALGCEISGITLAQAVEPKMFGKVYEAFLDYELILFRGVDLPPATQVAFAKSFGEVQIHVMNQYQKYPEHPEIYMLTNADKDGKPTGKHPDKGTLHWHTDGSWRERTGQATMMYSEIVPEEGGETEFADMYAAYDRLPPAMRAKVEGRRAVNHYVYNSVVRGDKQGVDATSQAAHPVIRTHDETNRKAIYVNRLMTVKIEGMSEQESDALLNFLFDHCEKPEFVYTHVWRKGDLIIWDNRCSSHARTDFPSDQRRLLLRTTVKGICKPY